MFEVWTGLPLSRFLVKFGLTELRLFKQRLDAEERRKRLRNVSRKSDPGRGNSKKKALSRSTAGILEQRAASVAAAEEVGGQ